MSYLMLPDETLITIEGFPQFDSTSWRALADGEPVGDVSNSHREAMAAVLAIHADVRPVPRELNPAAALGAFEQEDWAYALGNEYGRNGVDAFGELDDAPLNGEWSGGMSPALVFELVVGRAPGDDEFDDIERFCDAWEDGYRAN